MDAHFRVSSLVNFRLEVVQQAVEVPRCGGRLALSLEFQIKPLGIGFVSAVTHTAAAAAAEVLHIGFVCLAL